MQKSIALLLLLALSVSAGEKRAVQFRLRKDPAARIRAYCLEADEAGMAIERIGTRKKERIAWADIVEGDARRLRIEFKLELTEDEKKGLIPGHEVYFRGGMSVRGIVEKRDEERGEIVIRTDGMVLAYPLDRLDRVEDVKIQEAEAYDEDEIYVMRLKNRPPTNWGDHRRLADYMYEVGNYGKAKEHYEEVIRLRPEMRERYAERLADVEAILEDEQSLLVIQKAKSIANLWGRYAEARQMLESHAEENPGSRRRIVRVVDELEEIRIRKATVRYHRVKTREADRVIKKYLLTKAPTLAEARSWITTMFEKELMERVERRMNMSDEELDGIRKTEPTGSTHWATYANGSFVIDPKAKKGKSSGKDVRGDPERWWRGYGDVQTRSTWLKAYAAEKLPELFEVVTVRETACEKCGGTGVVQHTSVRQLKSVGNGHSWKQTCPRCYGAGKDRAIGYK